MFPCSLSGIQVALLLVAAIGRETGGVFNSLDSSPTKLTEPCLLLLEGRQGETGFVCELRGADAALVGPKILEIDGAIVRFLEAADVVSGTSTLFSPDLFITESAIELSGDVVDTNKIIVSTSPSLLSKRIEGEKTVLVVRIHASDKLNDYSESQLSESIFGNGVDLVNLVSQYSDCSAGKLKFIQASDRTGTSLKITNGVTTVYTNLPSADWQNAKRYKVTEILMSDFAVSSPSELANYVIYCMPYVEGMYNSAYYNYWQSNLKDWSCATVLGTVMHEVGHNLGLSHAGDVDYPNEGAYGDLTGYMGSYDYEDDGPRRCFNGAKSWQLGWYKDRETSLRTCSEGDTHLMKLVGVADYASSNKSQNVVVQVTGGSEGYYVAFNRQIGMNSGTYYEVADKVLVTHTSGKESLLAAKLNIGDKYVIPNDSSSGKQIVVEVKNINFDSSTAVATVKITNACTSHTETITVDKQMSVGAAIEVTFNSPSPLGTNYVGILDAYREVSLKLYTCGRQDQCEGAPPMEGSVIFDAENPGDYEGSFPIPVGNYEVCLFNENNKWFDQIGECKNIEIVTTTTTIAPTTFKDPCANLKPAKCRKTQQCVFTKKKIVKTCLPKKDTYKHDCAQHEGGKACRAIEVCKFASGKCFHRCEGLGKNKCIAEKFCKPAKIQNPCLGCQLVVTCGPSR